MDQMVSKVGKVMKKEFLDNVLGPKCGKSGLISKARVSVRVIGLGLGLAFEGVKMATFNGPDGVQGWESDEKRVFGQRFGPKVWKNGPQGDGPILHRPLCGKITVLKRCEKIALCTAIRPWTALGNGPLTGYFII